MLRIIRSHYYWVCQVTFEINSDAAKLDVDQSSRIVEIKCVSTH